MPYKFNPFTSTLDYYESGNSTVATANIKQDIAPSETPDGSRVEFTVPDEYLTGSIQVFLNGQAETYFSETSSTTITFDTAPLTGDVIRFSYAIITP